MKLSFDLTPGFKKLSIIVGVIAALVMADMLTRQYDTKRAKLDYLCVYQFANNCSCAVGNNACLAHCAALRDTHRATCMEDMRPTYYKLHDQFIWALLIFLPLAYGLGVGAVWAISRLRKTP